jgi:hypothetical protein
MNKLCYTHTETKTTDQESIEPPSKCELNIFHLFKKNNIVSKGMPSGCKTVEESFEN